MKSQLIAIVAAVLLVGCGAPSIADLPLFDAAMEGNIEAVKEAIADGADVNAMGFGMTPLHHAAYYGHKEIAELLIANGADVNAKNKQAATPLHLAALGGHKGHKKVAELLINGGADVNAKGLLGATPLDFSITKKQNEIINLLRKHGGITGGELKAAGN